MTLSALIRKRGTENLATAIPAISATQPKGESGTVATVATVAVANPQESKPIQPMTEAEAQTVRVWLASTNEPDPAEVERIFHLCQTDPITRGDVLHWASELPRPPAGQDDRRTCEQCANLVGSRCAAAFRGELNADRRHEPIQNLPRRCEGFAPVAGDPDQRPGRERWPELIQ